MNSVLFIIIYYSNTLSLEKYIELRVINVEADIKAFDLPLDKIEKHGTPTQPKSVFLFSGHMVDSPDRTEKRFPNDKKYIDSAANAIAAKLDELGVSKYDSALCGGACGGDLLFAESCLERDWH